MKKVTICWKVAIEANTLAIDASTETEIQDNLEYQPTTLDRAALRTEALRQSPEYRQARLQSAAAEAGVQQASRNFLPNISGIGAYGGSQLELNPNWSIALYRIAQEALTNVTRHARANKVHVELAREEGGIRLRIIDDGVGIPDGATSQPKSHGLVGMRERMRQIGGVVRFGPKEGERGTIVDAFIPDAAVVGKH